MKDRRILIPFILITAATFILNMSMQMSIPTFSVYLKSLGFPIGYIGAVSLSTALAAMFFRPVSAILSRKIGSIESGLFGAALYLLAFTLLVTIKNPWVVVSARIIQGIGMGIGITTLGSVIAQIVPHEELLKGMNIYSLFASAASAVGPYLGMFLIMGGSYTTLFLSAGAFVLVGIAILTTLHFKVHLPLPEGLHTQKSGIPVWKSAALFPTVIAHITAIVYAGIASYLALYGIEVGIPNIGFFFLYSFAGLLLSRVTLHPLMRTFKLETLFAGSGIFYAIILVALVRFPSPLAWSLISVGYGFIFNILSTLLNTMAIKNVPVSDKAGANALLFVGLDSGFFLGGLLWGQVAAAFSTAMIFTASAVLITLAMGIGALVIRQRQIRF